MNRHFSLLAIILLSGSLSIDVAFSEISSPKEQLRNGVLPNEIICKEGLTLMIRITNDSPICVKPHTADKLVQNDFATMPKIDQQEQNDQTVESTVKPADDIPFLIQRDLGCGNIASSDPDTQVMIVENNLDCIPVFFEGLESDPQKHLSAFYKLVSSPITTDRLFSYMYDELYYDRFEMDEETIDDMIIQLPDAIENCEGSFRCPDWQTFIVPYLSRTEEHLGHGTSYDCSKITGRDELIKALHDADYYCTESVALAISPIADESIIHELLNMMETDESENARRNAARILIRFAEHLEDKTPHILVTKTLEKDIKDSIISVLKKENASYVIPELTVLIDAHFRPFFETQPYLESISKDPKFDAVARWRAMSAIRQMTYDKESLTESDVKFVLDSMRSDDLWVRAEAAFICEILRDDQVDQSQKNRLVSGLKEAYDVEDKLIPKSFITKALDRHNKTGLYGKLEADFEKSRLDKSVSKNGITIKSSLPVSELDGYLELMKVQRQAFFEIMGPQFVTPVKDDPNSSFTLILLATPDEYFDYMNAFVGYGASAGGLYLESKGTLYTFQRTTSQSTYTVEDLIKHEFMHYLQGRYVYSGMWNDPDYHSEPKGWADEGLAEFFAQSVIASDYDHNIERPQKYLGEICGKDEHRDLDSLLTQREGYDQFGQWDYANAWAFAHYIMTEQKDAARNLYSSFRDGSYRLDDFAAISGSSIDSLESNWHDSMEDWCKSR
ncbi:MAG: collagenase [Nitrososphaerota archaeon]